MDDQTLTAQAYKKLSEIERQLRKQTRVDKKRSQQWVATFIRWCDAHEIELGPRLSHQSLRFDRALIQQVNEALRSQRLTTIEQWQSGLTSAAQAEQGVNEDKSNREGPRAQRVLVNTPASAPAWLSAQPRSMHDVDWRDINLEACDVLIQVENLDSFYAFSPQQRALNGYKQPLVVYRGDSHYGGGFKQLASAWNGTQKPHLYAGDFDVKGLSVALSSGTSHLLLPPLAWLTEQATTFHDPAKQLDHRPRLLSHRDQLPAEHPLQPYLTLLLDQQRGLRQQWLGEELERVALV
ncbi:DUF7281 domain-containing protein [Vreelandella gomseomensis]|uniref:DUF7281 domain-containing protein n=1 Tax=Vreelandella gomseomensis TaxID=370766 RepID=A0ABU1GDG1_9GAMM|nr:hypothetical protein [Halomonas gomseomensis]MDR5875527.1 hypothetical protein [Halomonas gomseomensis]